MDINPVEPNGGAVLVAVAVIGGAARQAHQWLGGHRPTWRHFIARAVVSLFVGVVCCYALPQQSPWSFAVTGLLGWMGADGIGLLIDILIKTDKRK